MTGQVPDTFIFQEESHAISAIEHPETFFSIDSLGLQPIPISTDCRRGYVASFTMLDNGSLILRDLEVCDGRSLENPILSINSQRPEVVNSAEPTPPRHNGYRNLKYQSIDLPLPYTGAILIAKDFIRSLYVHQGFQSPFSYETVIELRFEKGELTVTTDLSETAAQLRSQQDPNDMAGKQTDLVRWIAERYDLSRGYQALQSMLE